MSAAQRTALAGIRVAELGEGAGLAYAGKLFAGCYALYAGLVFIVTAAIMLTPVLHRLLHRFHWPEDGGGED